MITTVTLGLLLTVTATAAAEIKAKKSKLHFELVIGTTTTVSGVFFDIDLSGMLSGDTRVSGSQFSGTEPGFELRSVTDEQVLPLDRAQVVAGGILVQGKIIVGDNLKEKLKLLRKDDTYIHIDGPLRVPLTDGDVIIISPEVMRQISQSRIIISDADEQMLVDARGGMAALYQNGIDFGTSVSRADSLQREYNLSFEYYDRPWSSAPWWAIHATGLISTESDNPYSRLDIYPVAVGSRSGLANGSPFRTHELMASLGVQGDQSWRYQRAALDLNYSTLTPNLVNLTGGAHRLRLKPVITLGVQLWHEFNEDEAVGNDAGGRVGGELYYYIPVMSRYSILLVGEFGLPFGKIKDKLDAPDSYGKLDITFGLEVIEDLKLIAKYTVGQNDLTFTDDNQLLLGLTADMFKLGGGEMPTLK